MRKWLVILAVAVMLCGVGVILYPLVSNELAANRQEQVILDNEQQLADTSDDELTAAMTAAAQYNTVLRGAVVDGSAAGADYYSLLNVAGDGVMGVLEIDKISLRLPIYHGTDEEFLQKGVGHIYGTSLPIGGKGTHAALSGHSGMAGQKMFSDLHQIVVGDRFTLQVLGQRMIYEVDSVTTVLPHEAEGLAIEADKDMVTLVTCTPFGVNTHRLLVRGVRVTETVSDEPTKEPSANDETLEPTGSTWYAEYRSALLPGLGGGGVIIAAAVVYLLITKRKRKGAEKNGR